MNEPKRMISLLEFRRLLFEIKEHRRDIGIRYRLLGQMWAVNFLRVIDLTEKGVLLNDEISNKFISIPDLHPIIQFELDKPFQSFQPHFHYEVLPSTEW